MEQLLPKATLRRAAQYLRMSREHQKYSPITQATALACYAAAHGLEIVRTYRDDGRSGLSLKGRDGLQNLLADALSGKAPFAHVLVLDVSRWGRFQDPDQAAHYEFICREAGLQVHYCSEPFANDGSTATAILKQLKRVMAAEYSRELGNRVWAGQANGTRNGFKQGGTAPFGVRRQLIDERGQAIRTLRRGQRKSVQTDRVVLIHGPPEEIAAVQKVFRWFTRDGLCFREIARRLEAGGCRFEDGSPITPTRVGLMLRNEIYAGVYTWNRTNQRLKRAIGRNSPDEWVRAAVFEPMVSQRTFRRAQVRLKERYRLQARYSDEDLLEHLRRVQAVRGEVTAAVLLAEERPSFALYYRRFGSLGAALALAGVPRPFAARASQGAPRWPRERLVTGLQSIFREHGHITTALINSDPTLPSSSYIRGHFGALADAYRAAGWNVEDDELRLLANARRWSGHSAKRLAEQP